MIDANDIDQTTFPLRLTSEQRQVLDHYALCHEQGPGPHRVNISVRRIVLFLSGCLAICVGSVAFAKRIPPELSFMLFGFIIGALFMSTRQHMLFERHWPLTDSIIDWKHVERMRKDSDLLVDRDACPGVGPERALMTYADAVIRLVNHANLPGTELPMEESLLGALWIASRGSPAPNLEPLVNDVIGCLEAVNRGLNGPCPSATIERVNEGDIRRVAYPISRILDGLLQRAHGAGGMPSCGVKDEPMIEAAVRINLAWCQVLAGDIDDIPEELRVEMLCRRPADTPEGETPLTVAPPSEPS